MSEVRERQVFGHRLRHYRLQAGLTLAELGVAVGRPQSTLSQLENGHSEPRLSLIGELAAALGCASADLLRDELPSRRAELEFRLLAAQEDPLYGRLRLPRLKPSKKLPDAALEHIVALYDELKAANRGPARLEDATDESANAALRAEMRARNNYFAHIENAAGRGLAAAGYEGSGPLSERMLLDLAAHLGFTVERVQAMPRSARSITDQRSRVIYIPQRNDLKNRAARSVILQTLGHYVLGHTEPESFAAYLKQRVESNYFAAAVLAPEGAAVESIGKAVEAHDISVDDLRGIFYISYEMAAHRLTNLLTQHFDITLHFLRSDEEGVIWKAYENDDVPLPTGGQGMIEGQRLCREWGTRKAFVSDDSYDLHYQYTDTAQGEFWCVTYLEADRDPRHAVTVGTDKAQARYFRGSDTTRHSVSSCPDPSCCRTPTPAQATKWSEDAWPSASDRSHVMASLPRARPSFSPYPGVDLVEVYDFLDQR